MGLKATTFFDNRVNFNVDVTQKPVKSAADYRSKRLNYIVIPFFNIIQGWRGASEMVLKFNFNFAKNISLIQFTRNPLGNYIPCISYKPSSETIVRYKLFEGIGELLYVPLYAGQKILKDFFIEIWNINTFPSVISGQEKIYLSTLTLDSDRCETGDINQTGNLRNCTDLIFNLAGYVPINGDYYNVVGDCGTTQLINL